MISFFKSLFSKKHPSYVAGENVKITSVRTFTIVKDTTGTISVPTYEAVYCGTGKEQFLYFNAEANDLKVMSKEIRKEYLKQTSVMKKKIKAESHVSRVTESAANIKKLYSRYSIFPIDEILPKLVGVSRNKSKSKMIEYKDIKINASSRRYKCFKKSTNCCSCGLVGRFFAAEKRMENPPEHYLFNLYGIDENGREIIMTCDHIVPKSKGGSSKYDNVQTLCWKCNALKANKIEVKDEI